MHILGIETSCDETSAAVLTDRYEVLSNVVLSQDEVHAPYGGVVPELASRQHIKAIDLVVGEALAKAGVALAAVDAYAVTQGPGLIGSLLVGLSFAKGLAYFHGKPLFGVDHLEGHIEAAFLENRDIAFPALALLVSGGHTSLYLLERMLSYRLLGKTRDDAAGEALDKIAKFLGLGYPGGPVIEKLAAGGDPEDIRLHPAADQGRAVRLQLQRAQDGGAETHPGFGRHEGRPRAPRFPGELRGGGGPGARRERRPGRRGASTRNRSSSAAGSPGTSVFGQGSRNRPPA